MEVAENEMVIVQVGLHGLFVKVVVTPVGIGEAEKVMSAVVLPVGVAVIDEVELVEP